MPYNFGEMPEKKNENNMGVTKKLLKFFKEYLGIIEIVLSILPALFYAVLSFNYKNSAEKYYGIPGEYFNLNIFSIISLFVFIVLVLCLGIFVYNEYNQNNNQKQYCNIMIGIFCFIPTILSYMYLCRLLTFVIKSKFIISKTLSFSSLAFLFLLFGIYYIYFISFKFVVSIRGKIQISRAEKMKSIIYLIPTFILLFLSLFNIIEINIFNSVENKKTYEIYYKNGNSKAVITRIGEKYIIADCVIKKDKILEQMNDLIIYTKNYKEVSLNGIERNYQTFREVKVDKNKILKRNNNLIIYRKNYEEISFEKMERIMQLFELEN